MRPVLRQAAVGRRVVDLIVQVWLPNGETTWLLVHAEVSGRLDAAQVLAMLIFLGALRG